MNTSEYSLHCVACADECTEQDSTTACPSCGEQLDIIYDTEDILRTLNEHSLKTTPITATKYLRFLPVVDYRKIVSLDEGGTPLQHCTKLGQKLNLPNLYVKNEGANPTGVFKDRGSMVEITKAVELGASAVACASTGNMAASVSAYAAVAGLPCYVVVPEGTPLGKLAQTISYGARIIQIRGTYADCVPLCEEMAKKHNFYLAGDYAYRSEGYKSSAYEIVEQLGWRCPDVVIVPVGCGTHIAGIWKGFQDYHALGLIDKLPRMIGVQPESVPTIMVAWQNGDDRYFKVENPASVASAVSIGVPQDDIKVLRTLRDSQGCCETATDDEILDAEQELARLESLFVEPSSAIPIATLQKLMTAGAISQNETVVCVATGTGLKDPKTAISHLPDPPVLEPTNEEVERYLSMKLYEIKGSIAKQKLLFETEPSLEELQSVLHEEFNAHFDEKIVAGIHSLTNDFIAKGRSVNRADMQFIIESFLNEFSSREKVLVIDDFRVTDSLRQKATGDVKGTFHGETFSVTGEGDGTFDAIINALQTVFRDEQSHVQLLDYSVGVETPGTETVVKVTMTLTDEQGNKAICNATSPDVIVASVYAFEKGYNILYWKNRSNGKKPEAKNQKPEGS